MLRDIVTYELNVECLHSFEIRIEIIALSIWLSALIFGPIKVRVLIKKIPMRKYL